MKQTENPSYFDLFRTFFWKGHTADKPKKLISDIEKAQMIIPNGNPFAQPDGFDGLAIKNDSCRVADERAVPPIRV